MKIYGKVRVALISTCIITLAGLALNATSYIYATPETQSLFYKTYSLSETTDKYRSQNQSSFSGHSAAAGAGKEFAHHQSTWDNQFVVAASKREQLLLAIRSDLLEKLKQSGAVVMDQAGDDQVRGVNGQFRLRYRAGTTNGAVLILPLEIVEAGSTGRHAMCAKEDFVRLVVKADERWFKSEQAAQQGGWPELR